MLDTLDFTVSELWALFNFPQSTTLAFCRLDQRMSSRHHGAHHKPQTVGNKTSHIKFHHRTTDQSAVILKLVPPQERALKLELKNILIGRGVCMGDITTILGKKREYDLPHACTNRFQRSFIPAMCRLANNNLV